MYTLKELTDAREDLLNTKPKTLVVGKENILLHRYTWAEVIVEIIKWLRSSGFIDVTDCPVPDCHKAGKYFINIEERHQNAYRDATWKRVGPLRINVKYNTMDQIQNIRGLLRHLGIQDPGIMIEIW